RRLRVRSNGGARDRAGHTSASLLWWKPGTAGEFQDQNIPRPNSRAPVSFAKPGFVNSRVRLDLVRLEEQGDLTLGALCRIGTVNDVAPDREGEIPADRSGLRLRGIRLAHHPTDGGHRTVSFEDHRNHGSRRDVRHEWLEERFPLVFRVVRLSEGPCD